VPAASGAFGPIAADHASPTPGSEAITDGSSKGQPVVPSRSTPDLNVSIGNTLAADSNGVSMLIVLSGAFLVAGLGLFLIRWMARRLASE
jgi:hypothetical protein